MPKKDVYVTVVFNKPAWLNHAGTEADPISISSAAEWGEFASYVSGGINFSGQYVKLTGDISVTTMAGADDAKSFQGTFDGNGKTLTFTRGTAESPFSEDYCAPFRHVKNATIKNLHVGGTIYTSAMKAAGVVGESHGALTIEGCRSSVAIISSVSGDGTHGGLVSTLSGQDNTIIIDGCVFDGSFATTAGTTNCGGFVGWPVYNTPTIKNSLMKPASVDAGMLNNTFARWHDGYEPTLTNCYYTETLGTAQATQAYTLDTAPDGLGEVVKNYGFTTAYANGILFDGTYYVAPATVTLADNADNNTVLSGFAGQVANVTLQDRTLTKNGDWNTLCLPFAMDATQIAASSLAGATIKELNTETSNLNPADGMLTLNFTTAYDPTDAPSGSIVAGKPYIVKWATTGDNISNPVFPGVTISSTEPTAVEFAIDGSTDKCQFVGQYSPFTIGDTSTGTFDGDLNEIIMLGSNSTLGYSQNARTLKCFRAHFLVPADPATGQRQARRFVMDFGEGSSQTGILTVTADTPSAAGIFTLDGRRLQAEPTEKACTL